ncbi:MAG TPA: carboxypeptidase-like regulatory domain-containing protein [Solirubrobacteraceae bacterium]|jgi:hypothetical protein|nr:carboxypeptidase-like regulatory domain-containing protein [Solirubrobacteraceae bacterium]
MLRNIPIKLSRIALAGIAASLGSLAVANTASALEAPPDGTGNYTQVLCADPASGEGLGLSGMPEGLSNPASTDLWQVTAVRVDCGSGPITSSRGIPMLVGQSNTYAQGTWSALLYQAPPNTTINSGQIYRAEKAEGPDSGFMGIIQQGGEYGSLYSLPRNCCDQGDWFVGNVAARGTFARPFSPENLVDLTISPDGEHWNVNATCDPNGNNNSSCTLTAGQWEYRIYGGEISLHAANDPQASNMTGPLTSENPLRGDPSLSFSATDDGPGIAYLKVLVDGQVEQSEIIDTNGGRCIPVAPGDAYTWVYQVPCKTSLGGRTFSLETTDLANGPHHVQVLIEDAAGNQSEILDRTVNVENPTTATLATPIASGTLLQPGIANGAAADRHAQLTLAGASHLTRAYGARALRLTGKLTDASGLPIAGAALEASEQVDGSSATRSLVGTQTSSDGSFVLAVPAGPSRTVEIGYRAFSGEASYASQAEIHEAVSAGVQMHVAPRRTTADGTIALSGTVAGPVPARGVVVELLVHYRGRWVPFRTPRTNSQGRFRVNYSFQGGVGRFPFRALVFAGQVGFPFGDGESRAVEVLTG